MARYISRYDYDQDPNPYKKCVHSMLSEAYYFVWEAYNSNTPKAWKTANECREGLEYRWWNVPTFDQTSNAEEWVEKFKEEAKIK